MRNVPRIPFDQGCARTKDTRCFANLCICVTLAPLSAGYHFLRADFIKRYIHWRAAHLRHIFAISTIAAWFAGPLLAEPVAHTNTNALWFEDWGGFSNARLVVTTPSGKTFNISSAKGTPVYELSGNPILDGVYNYELSAATGKTVKIINPIDNGRGSHEKTKTLAPYSLTGRFIVTRGVIDAEAQRIQEAPLK